MEEQKSKKGRREGNDSAELRKKILNTARSILSEDPSGKTLTIRKVAKLSGVGIGLIPYYFGNRENLLSEAVGEGISTNFKTMLDNYSDEGLSVTELLISFLSEAAEMLMRHEKAFRLPVELELKGLSSGTTKVILPLLKKLPKFAGSDDDAYIAALQILHPLQSIFINSRKLEELTDYSVDDPRSVEQLIRRIVTNITG